MFFRPKGATVGLVCLAIRDIKDLHAFEILILYTVNTINTKRSCIYSLESLSALMKIGLTPTKKYLKKLEDKNLIQIKRHKSPGRGYANEMNLCFMNILEAGGKLYLLNKPVDNSQENKIKGSSGDPLIPKRGRLAIQKGSPRDYQDIVLNKLKEKREISAESAPDSLTFCAEQKPITNKTKTKTFLTENYCPTDEALHYAKTIGLTDNDYKHEFKMFMKHYLGEDIQKSSWDKQFIWWLDQALAHKSKHTKTKYQQQDLPRPFDANDPLNRAPIDHAVSVSSEQDAIDEEKQKQNNISKLREVMKILKGGATNGMVRTKAEQDTRRGAAQVLGNVRGGSSPYEQCRKVSTYAVPERRRG